MFRRSNKITALLVAAASVMTMVPAMAADSTVRLGTKTGTVKEGVAYADGKYAFYGYRTDDDHTGVYYNKGGDAKDTFNSDLEDYRLDLTSKYGNQYAYAKENSNTDEYLVDLSTGSINNDTTAEEKSDNTKADLKANLKRAERYSSIKDDTGAITSLERINQDRFGDVWYKYIANGDTNTATSSSYVGGTKTTAKVILPDFPLVAGNIAFGGKTYACDPAGVAGTQGTITIVIPAIGALADPAGTVKTVKVNGQSFSVVEGTTTQGDLNATVLSAVKSFSNGSWDFAHASIAANTITVKDSAFNEYTTSQLNALKKQFDASDDFAATGTQVATATANATSGLNASSTVAASQSELNSKILADVKANTTSALANLFDVANATISGGRLVLQTKDSKEHYQSEYNTALAGYNVDSITAGTPATQNTTGGDLVKYAGFTDDAGKYIDASYLANMYVFSTKKGRAVKIENFNKLNEDAQLTVTMDPADIEAIDQDKDYIYAIAKVTVEDSNNNTSSTQYFLQKISKARGDQHDGAYLPKSVTSYKIDEEKQYDNGDTKDAADCLLNADFDGHNTLLGAHVVGGNTVYVTRANLNSDSNKDNIKVYKLEMKDSVKADVLDADAAVLKTDVDAPLLKKTGDSDQDVKLKEVKDSVAEDEGLQGVQKQEKIDANGDTVDLTINGNVVYRHPEVSFDTAGNTWVLNKGDVIKFAGTDKKTMYTTDIGMDAIDVYDDNSLIAWDMSGDAYTTVQEGKTVTEADGITVNPDINKDKFKNGYDATEKKFYKDGKVVTNDWASDNGKWYLLDANGTALTGWQQKGAWYLLGADGAMLTGWQQNGGNWYYLNPVNSAGNMVTGWFQDTTGNWYYTDASGKMLSNTVVDGYTLGANGAWVK